MIKKINEVMTTPAKASVPSLPPTPAKRFLDKRSNPAVKKLAVMINRKFGATPELDMPIKAPQ